MGEVQAGLEPNDWKPFHDIGPGTREVRIRDSRVFRIIYVARFEEAVYVLHCFQKTTQVTTRQDKMIAQARYQDVVRVRRNES